MRKTVENLLVRALAALVAWSPLASIGHADPCGMVPPIWLGDGPAITRIGVQKTYVFWKDGIETFVIRPGFSGQVEEFGMLIPFPSPPAIRKVADDVFPHVAAAVDPPEVVIDLNVRYLACADSVMSLRASGPREEKLGFKEQVTVLKQEAVGMYEVAVLEAGSAAALQRWMDDHGFRYPEGMDGTVEDYVQERWCFVAVRARVGDKSATEARPGMREIDPSLPPGSSFDGHVQAMGFRFRSEQLVVPMRLSAFNEGELRNVVYVLTDEPKRIVDVPDEYVVRQIPGHRLYRNLTEPLPLRIVGGNISNLPEWRRQSLPAERDPHRHNGIAKELFASDLQAARLQRLAHPHEEQEKRLLAIGEELGLRGKWLDSLHQEAIKEERARTVREALKDLRGMTLTVIDGDFPREVLARQNLTFASFRMANRQNDPLHYDAKHFGPLPGILSVPLPPVPPASAFYAAVATMLVGLAAAFLVTRRREQLATIGRYAAPALLAVGCATLLTSLAPAATPDRVDPTPIDRWIEELDDEAYGPGALAALVQVGPAAVADLGEAAAHHRSITLRGWAVVALSRIGGSEAERTLRDLAGSSSGLVQTWAGAARARLADEPAELLEVTRLISSLPALDRPIKARWLSLWSAAEADTKTLAALLDACAAAPAIQQDLLRTAITARPELFLEVMTGASEQNARRLAAGALATQAGMGVEGIADQVVATFAFDNEATDVPWAGGPLFVPSLAWKPADARALVRHLLAWHVWCEERGRRAEQTQIHNNLRGVGLAQAAGYASPGWQEVGTYAWLEVWLRAYGRVDLQRLLEEQGLSNEARYVKILNLR